MDLKKILSQGVLAGAFGLSLFLGAAAGPAQASGTIAPSTFQALQAEQSVIRTLQVALRETFGIKVTAVAAFDARTWTILRNQPFGLAIGNGRVGWEFDPATISRLGYTSGWVHGTWEGCAWTATRNVGGNVIPVRGDCANFNPPLKSFTSRINCILCHGGTAVRLTEPATEFANYNPTTGPRDPVHKAEVGQCVEWRYITKDGKFAMVKDRRFANNRASWVFIPRNTLPADSQLPKNSQNSCWHRSKTRVLGN
jgi:hypothetical protein